jgi:hypothetical protein
MYVPGREGSRRRPRPDSRAGGLAQRRPAGRMSHQSQPCYRTRQAPDISGWGRKTVGARLRAMVLEYHCDPAEGLGAVAFDDQAIETRQRGDTNDVRDGSAR